MWETSWILSDHPLRVRQYMVLCMGSLSTSPLMMFNLSGVQCMLWTFWCSSISIFSFCYWKLLRQSAKTISFPGLYCIV